MKQKVQVNLWLPEQLAVMLRVEAAQLQMRVSEYVTLILARREELIK